MTTLDTTNARAFNASLKKLLKENTGDNSIKVEIINSYKFPKCWVRVHSKVGFSNDFRLSVFDACNYEREGLLNVNDVSYGNIQKSNVSAVVSQWVNFSNNLN